MCTPGTTGHRRNRTAVACARAVLRLPPWPSSRNDGTLHCAVRGAATCRFLRTPRPTPFPVTAVVTDGTTTLGPAVNKYRGPVSLFLREWFDVRHQPRPLRRPDRSCVGSATSGGLPSRGGLAPRPRCAAPPGMRRESAGASTMAAMAGAALLDLDQPFVHFLGRNPFPGPSGGSMNGCRRNRRRAWPTRSASAWPWPWSMPPLQLWRVDRGQR